LGKFLGVPLLFFIILSTAVVGGVWLFQKQQSEQLAQANKALNETYTQISGMQTHMVEGVKDLMNLRDDMEKRIGERQKAAEDIEKRAADAKSRADEADKLVKAKVDELAKLNETKNQAEQSWAKLKDDKEALSKERDELKTRLQNEAVASGKQLGSLRSLIADVSAKLEQGDVEGAKTKLDEIRLEQLDLRSVLEKFAATPSFETASEMERNLKGVTLEKFIEIIKQVANWTDWIRINNGSKETAVFGTLKRSGNSLEWVIRFLFDDRLSDVTPTKSVFVVSGIDVADPLSPASYILFEDKDRIRAMQSRQPSRTTPTTWNLAVLYQFDDPAATVSRIKGEDYALPVISPEQARNSISDVIQKIPIDAPFAKMLAMMDRQKSWSATAPPVAGVDRLPEEIRSPFVDAINAAALGGSLLGDQMRKTKLDRAKFGQIAAAVLQPSFIIEEVKESPFRPIYDQSAPVHSNDIRTVIANRSARYARGEKVEFTFERATGATEWVLKDFRRAGLIDPAYQNKATAD